MPGMAASTRETWEFGAPPNSVEAPENSFERDVTWACTSMPMTISQSPVAPLTSLEDLSAMGAVYRRLRRTTSRPAALPSEQREQQRQHPHGDGDGSGPQGEGQIGLAQDHRARPLRIGLGRARVLRQ